jgi:hypothetical protein
MKVGICLITKNCYGPYLTDWLQYHTDLGVDVFYIYDNESNPSVINKSGSQLIDFNAHVIRIQGEVAQLPAYQHCIENIKNGSLEACDRVAFIDDDEFITCENNDIKKTLEKYEAHSGLGINWLLYGSSGVKTRTPISQRKKFVHHLPPQDVVHKHIKSIVNPQKVIGFREPHSCVYIEGSCVDVDFNPVHGAFTQKPIHHTIWLNHYWSRSEEEFKIKIERGRADTNVKEFSPKMQEFYDRDTEAIYTNLNK